ncbi:MAG: hypothetical protein ICV59_09600, partial [Thermoleophilia bacterium]|nr:hypothetical protein [Thermoleophilia bacterium]
TFVRGARRTIVAVGATEERAGEHFALVRSRGDGGLDRTFGTGGIVRTSIGGSSVADDAVVQRDGRMIVVGCAGAQAHDCGGDLALARYQPDGSLDPAFGEHGIVRTGFGPRTEGNANAVALQVDGRIVVAGGLFSTASPRYEFLIARYLPDGTLDASFGDAGVVRLPSSDIAGSELDEVVVDRAGRIVVAGAAIFSRTSDGVRVIRLRPDGGRDRNFGSNGTVAVTLSSTPPCCSRVGALHVAPDGTVVVAGQDSALQRRFAVVRIMPSGRLDRRFARHGVFVRRWHGDAWGMVQELIPAGRRLLAVGYATRGRARIRRSLEFVALRLLADGRLDASYGAGGRPSSAAGVPAVAAFRDKSWLLVAGADDNPTGRLRGRVVFARLPLR